MPLLEHVSGSARSLAIRHSNLVGGYFGLKTLSVQPHSSSSIPTARTLSITVRRAVHQESWRQRGYLGLDVRDAHQRSINSSNSNPFTAASPLYDELLESQETLHDGVETFQPMMNDVEYLPTIETDMYSHDPSNDEHAQSKSEITSRESFAKEAPHHGNERSRTRLDTFNARIRQDHDDILDLVDRKNSPRSLRNILKPSPSLHLEHALSEAHDPRVMPRPRPRSVHDLSYRDAKTLRITNVNGCYKPKVDATVSLQSITAEYIRWIIRQRARESEFTAFGSAPCNDFTLRPDEDAFLQAHLLTKQDVRKWADILLEPDTTLAARLLTDRPPSSKQNNRPASPWFVMNFFLRREVVAPEALRHLLDYAWQLLKHQERRWQMDPTQTIQALGAQMIMALCVRLVRHARDVWPQALPNIVKIFSTYTLDRRAEYHKSIGKPLSHSLLKDLAFKTNRMLSQLSLVGRHYPILSATHQQRAQFDLIRKMIQFSPSIPINREGHRALTKTLLMLKKTPQERDWALLQARSWPPFKVSKTRLDDPKDRMYATSSAGKSINFMQAYGYHMMTWDFLAQVFTGWSPDGSPVIQRRANTPSVPTSFAGEPGDDKLHAAIIMSTRTIPEAWSAFLKFDDRDGKSRAIFEAMFQKLLVHENEPLKRPQVLTHPGSVPALPGDGVEVWPAPSSPMEAVYLTTEPPSADALLTSLIERDIPIFGGMMSSLVSSAPSLAFGLRAWQVGKILVIREDGVPHWSKDHLHFMRSAKESQLNILPDIPSDLVSALVCLITRHPHTVQDLAILDRNDLQSAAWTFRSDHSFTYAYRLLVYYRPAWARPWNHLLKGLAQRGSLQHAIARVDRVRARYWPLIAWAVAGDVLRHMAPAGAFPTHDTFHCLCDIATDAALSAHVLHLDSEQDLQRSQPWEQKSKEALEAEALFHRGSSVLRRQFAKLVGLIKDQREDERSHYVGVPHNLAIPKAVVLHKYIRALGLLRDHEGIFSLARWMSLASNQLQELQETQLNGKRHLRQAIVALRVWLECPSRDFVVAERGIIIEAAPEELIQLVKQEIEQVQQWNGWPSDAEVSKYCSRHANYFTL